MLNSSLPGCVGVPQQPLFCRTATINQNEARATLCIGFADHRQGVLSHVSVRVGLAAFGHQLIVNQLKRILLKFGALYP